MKKQVFDFEDFGLLRYCVAEQIQIVKSDINFAQSMQQSKLNKLEIKGWRQHAKTQKLSLKRLNKLSAALENLKYEEITAFLKTLKAKPKNEKSQ